MPHFIIFISRRAKQLQKRAEINFIFFSLRGGAAARKKRNRTPQFYCSVRQYYNKVCRVRKRKRFLPARDARTQETLLSVRRRLLGDLSGPRALAKQLYDQYDRPAWLIYLYSMPCHPMREEILLKRQQLGWCNIWPPFVPIQFSRCERRKKRPRFMWFLYTKILHKTTLLITS